MPWPRLVAVAEYWQHCLTSMGSSRANSTNSNILSRDKYLAIFGLFLFEQLQNQVPYIDLPYKLFTAKGIRLAWEQQTYSRVVASLPPKNTVVIFWRETTGNTSAVRRLEGLIADAQIRLFYLRLACSLRNTR